METGFRSYNENDSRLERQFLRRNYPIDLKCRRFRAKPMEKGSTRVFGHRRRASNLLRRFSPQTIRYAYDY
jgi:hypothetical protein